MLTHVCTYPPLSQVTCVDSSTITFAVLLEVREERASDPWEVSLWHSGGSEWGKWRECPLRRLTEESSQLFSLQSSKTIPEPTLARIYFTSSVAVGLPTHFTVKFRNGPDRSWKWVRELLNEQDGLVIAKTVSDFERPSVRLPHYIRDFNRDLHYKKHRSQSPNTALWHVEVPIAASTDANSAWKTVRFGIPLGITKYLRWFALVRLWQPWIVPRQGKVRLELDKPAILCAFQDNDGKHLVLLAISGVDDVRMEMTSDHEGNVVLQLRHDGTEDATGKLLVALGDDFESANASVMYAAREVVAASKIATGEQHKEMIALGKDGPSTKFWAENWYDGLTYCTWNGLGQGLTEEKILNAADTLAKNKINVTNFIIDDNWQSIDYDSPIQWERGWKEFEAEPKAFPKGLKHTVSLLREKLPSIQHVAVWHAILGYWGAINPNGKIAKTYKTTKVCMEGEGERTVVAKEDLSKFYDDFYSFLSSCGVDGVKTDAQFYLDKLHYAKHRRDLILPYLDAWTVASLRHFNLKVISCMSLTPQHIFHNQLPQNRAPFLLRNSDDFFPDVLSSHTWHIFANAHNALLTQHLNVLPDWDMFQTVHDYSGFHAAGRCVSGGPIYITDVPGEHNFDLIKQMTGMTPRGKTVILRPSVVGKSLDPYKGYHDNCLLLVGTYHGAAATGTGIIGIFNISLQPLTEIIHLSRFPGTGQAQLYIVRAHSSGSISRPMQVVDSLATLTLSLDVRGYEILSAYPLRGFVDEEQAFTTWIANLGLLGKMAGAAGIVSNKMTKQETGKIVIDTSIKVLGVLGFYISTLPTLNWKENMLITILGKVIPVHTVSISKVDAHVLEIDIETAWEEMGLNSGYSNEVEVMVYINP